MKHRSAAEETYAKSLLKLSKQKESNYVDIGETRAAYTLVREELKLTADAHAAYVSGSAHPHHRATPAPSTTQRCQPMLTTSDHLVMDPRRFADLCGNVLEKKIMSFKDSQKGTRKQYEATIAEKRKSLSSTVYPPPVSNLRTLLLMPPEHSCRLTRSLSRLFPFPRLARSILIIKRTPL